MQAPDKSNGYEHIASAFIAGRGQDHAGVGVSVVAEWSQTLPPHATILDLGCGTGVPISEALITRGFRVFAVDASPSMVAAFRSRFPSVAIQCAAAEESDLFGRSFDAVLAWGLVFLLTPELQRRLIARMAAALVEGGHLLFTAPHERCSWTDAMTGLPSFSLGYEEYRSLLNTNNLHIDRKAIDEGQNHYYFARKISPAVERGVQSLEQLYTFAARASANSDSTDSSGTKSPFPIPGQ